MPASYPTSVKAFTTKNDGAGNTVLAAHVNDLQNEVMAIETDLIAGLPIARGGTGATSAAWSVNTLTFPAVQVPSVDANTLDDYEEGTWTPVLGGSGGTSGQTYTVQSGLYVKVGQIVTATFVIEVNNKGTITTNAQIQSLPFAAHATYGTMTAVGFSVLGATKVLVMAELLGGATAATLYGIGAAATSVFTALTTADISNGTIVRGTLTYRAAA
jgi:hypothetical protein